MAMIGEELRKLIPEGKPQKTVAMSGLTHGVSTTLTR